MNHLQRYLVDEFVEDYQEGTISRRKALKLLAGIVGLPAAASLLAACGQQQGQSPIVANPAPTSAATAPAAAPTAMAPASTTIIAPSAMAEPSAMAAPSAAAAPTTSTAPTTASAPSAAPAAPAGSGAVNVAPDDPAIIAEPVQFPGSDGQVLGYMARPAGEGSSPIVLVCHENRGLTAHIEDVTRRLAKAGYVGLAVDLLWRDGGTASIADPDSVPGLLSGAPPERHIADFQAGLDYVKAQPYAQADSVGMVGFCFGGGVTWLAATGIPELRAAVPFYGPPPPTTEVAKINAAVLAIYAERDARINGSIPTIEAAMQENGKTYNKIIYPGVDHAFHNDTGQRYSAEQAQAAWGETLAWFEQYLKA